MFLNILGFDLVGFLVDILVSAAWIIPLFFVVKNLVAFLTAPGPVAKQEALKALIQSAIILVALILFVILFNSFARPSLDL
jgi:hypothetical protein